MYHYCHAINSYRPDMPDDFLLELNVASVTGLALIDAVILSRYDIPSIYEIKPRYVTPKVEQWKDIFAVIADGAGDCKDFVAWRLAELWKMGVDATAESILTRQKTMLFHARIRHSNGNVEDPSMALGMLR